MLAVFGVPAFWPLTPPPGRIPHPRCYVPLDARSPASHRAAGFRRGGGLSYSGGAPSASGAPRGAGLSVRSPSAGRRGEAGGVVRAGRGGSQTERKAPSAPRSAPDGAGNRAARSSARTRLIGASRSGSPRPSSTGASSHSLGGWRRSRSVRRRRARAAGAAACVRSAALPSRLLAPGPRRECGGSCQRPEAAGGRCGQPLPPWPPAAPRVCASRAPPCRRTATEEVRDAREDGEAEPPGCPDGSTPEAHSRAQRLVGDSASAGAAPTAGPQPHEKPTRYVLRAHCQSLRSLFRITAANSR